MDGRWNWQSEARNELGALPLATECPVIAEWGLSDAQTAELLGAYRKISNDDAQHRTLDHILAYAICRMAWSKMAARASEGMAVPERSVTQELKPAAAF